MLISVSRLIVAFLKGTSNSIFPSYGCNRSRELVTASKNTILARNLLNCVTEVIHYHMKGDKSFCTSERKDFSRCRFYSVVKDDISCKCQDLLNSELRDERAGRL